MEEVEVIRIKDIERMLLVCSMFDYNPKVKQGDLIEMFVTQLYNPKRAAEKAKYPKCMPSALLFLSMKDIYLDDLSSHLLNTDFINAVYGKDFN